ncbi:MAG: Ldh family oxidoreductase [Lautropia sp.]|nr:Ldh family oxidoreductase [Lautropia sp.]
MSAAIFERARYQAEALTDFAERLLTEAGLQPAVARDVAEVLVEGDLLGHDTHGLALLGPYLSELEKGSMSKQGEPEVVNQRASVATWDGRRLPGPWLVRQAIAWARPRAQEHGCATVVIRRSHHIACLAAYLEKVARAGLLIEIHSSDPAVASVAPFGGTQAVFTPNPIAVGIPTSHDPILIDVSSSVTTNGLSNRMRAANVQGEHEWWLDSLGQPSNDPAVLFTTPPGTILPLGGLDSGHKGYGLLLMVEAMTGGLAGYGRADVPEGWGASVMVRITDPAAFGGSAEFTWQTDWLSDACHASAPRVPGQAVRLPGERGLARKAEQLAQGVALQPSIITSLNTWSTRHRIDLPEPIDS